jgi:hypothetical protein
MKTHDVFNSAAERFPYAATFWLSALSSLKIVDIDDIIGQVPPSLISDIASSFAKQMIYCNRTRLLRLGDQL